MIKRTMLLGIAGALLFSNVSFASPPVHLNQGDVQVGFSYLISKNKETYNGNGWNEKRNVNGHTQEYNVNIGLKNDYAVFLGFSNYHYDTFTDGSNQKTTPSIDSIDFGVQKRLTNNFAVFTGVKHVTGSWNYYNSAYTPSSITVNNSCENIAVFGFAGEIGLSDRVNAYVKAGVGHDFKEYKVGVSRGNLDVGYSYAKYQKLDNHQFGTFGVNGLDLTTKGFYFSVGHKL